MRVGAFNPRRRLALWLCTCLAAAAGTVGAAPSDGSAAGPRKPLQAEELKGLWTLLSRLGANSGDTQLKICNGDDCRSAGEKSVTEQRLNVEIGIRNGKLVGCQVSDDKGPNDSATCQLTVDSLQIEIGRSANKIVYELKKNTDGSISGESFMKSSAFPGGRLRIGEVSLQRPAKT